MRDFTLTIYKKLLIELLQAEYRFVTFAEFIQRDASHEKIIILRHDVDLRPNMAWDMAKLESALAIRSSYYFRARSGKFPIAIIKEIGKLGHEIGYHYEDLSEAQGDHKKALENFKSNIENLRRSFPVKTICMHGSPFSKFDNRELWKEMNYRDIGIIGEPYFDIDFSAVLYLTDTGRSWNRNTVNIRDKVAGSEILNAPQCLRTTKELISFLKSYYAPKRIMLNIHPQRWSDHYFIWIKEIGLQNIKNILKYLIVRKNQYL